MRRGHPGIGGWRNDNQRQFRPRSGGTVHFRGYRNPGILSTPRFPPPMAMPHRGPPLYADPQNDIKSGHNVYRHNLNYQRRDRSNQYSQRTPYSIQPMRYNVNLEQNNHQNYNEQCHINSMGDIDDRQPSQPEIYRRQPHWESSSVQNRRHSYNERGYKMFKHHDQPTVASTDYTGHRPPVSDHYGTNSGPDNSDSFSRSVDDTVNIVRERLLNRNDSQYITEQLNEHNSEVCRSIGHKPSNSNEVVHQEQTAKKRILKPRNAKPNCDQIKNKIVHQLFKMDKGKIHKLMDNPSSSSKFEFAISSLISESQNTLNRHLRSVAEKSLCSTTATELIQNNNDSIYEDTFMKQMQCILDPQDTVLLEDIKPIIMAELQKVLQLNEFDHRFEMTDEQIYQQHETQNYEYDNFEDNNDLYQDIDLREEKFSSYHVDDTTIETDFEHKPHLDHKHEPLFERRAKKTDVDEDRRNSMESRRQIRQSVDNIHNEQPQSTIPLFDSTTEQLSEDEDPFAELDRQYHVVVDHNLIEDDICDSQTSSFENPIPSDNQPENQVSFQKNTQDIKQEIDNQLHMLAKSPLKLFPPTNFDQHQIKQEYHESSGNINTSPKKYVVCHKDEKTSKEHQDDKSNCKLNVENQDCVDNVIKTTTPDKERKRSIDQRPSHRKEKRKKSDSFSSETNKQILNKNIIINVNDCAKKSSEKCEAPKSVFNLFFSKNESSKHKDAGKLGSVEKEYSDKYVKRKESPNKILKEKDKKRLNSNTSSHSTELSPSDKIDAKTKLKSIDMFLEQPKKVSPVVKKAAIPSNAPLIKRPIGESKKIINYSRKGVKTVNAAIQVMRKLPSKETQTFESRCMTSRFCQTENKKLSKSVQTDPVTFTTISVAESSDPLERMKQIDMEIQKLLQEKFKLYNSLESKDSCSSSMPTLGMTVLNVKESEPVEDDTFSGDAIADDFTNIPVEELEQIAFESVKEVSKRPKTVKRNSRQKIIEQERTSSESPPITKKSNKRINTPNISLIEQIITDDRPLEDIISLDEFEAPVKTRKKNKKTVPKKKLLKKNKKGVSIENLSQYHIKDCYVMLNRIELGKYNIQSRYETQKFEQNIKEIEISKGGNITVEIQESENTVVEETIVSDNTIQFDMLDVSEDIIIGESCEVKLADDKDVSERIEMTVSEEIILDNSQSSCEDVPAADLVQTDSHCKLYDYSADENLQRDATAVTGHADAVLAIEYIDNNFVAACLDGNVYYFSCEGHLISTLRGSNLAVTCLTIVKEKFGTTLYSGSLDSRIRYYDLETGLEKGPECNVLSPIQTMDRAWDTIFVGTRTGFVLQFECKNNMLIPVSSVKFSDQSILALRALKEGPRKVLLVAARSENVTIKDAQTGLLLRTLDGPKMTVYTLLYEDGKVFCGTSSHQIYVFDYYSGSHVGTHEGGKGAVCLRAAGGLVFAGCYDGCVYVYRDGETAPFAQLRGPSLMLLSLAVHETKIIAGYKDRSLYIWKIPFNILQEMIL